MDELKVLNIYDNIDDTKKDAFFNEIESDLDIKTEYQKITEDEEWIDIMELTIPYIDNILRNPNRFIINEEEIVKVELARRITVDSIKHLSRNTNFIQDFNQKTGDVRPSKILNINKEESYDTYENRFIYSLIENMKFFISRREKGIEERALLNNKDDKFVDYNATSKVNNEKVNIKIELNTCLDEKSDSNAILERIRILKRKIADVSCSETYKLLAKKHIALVRSPLKKTNVILKNVNFQYAVKLWNYLQENIEDKSKRENEKKTFIDNDKVKELIDETFLLDYLIIKSLDDEEEKNEKLNNQNRQKMTSQVLEKIVYLNSSLSEEQLKNMISDTYAKIKQKNMANIGEIQNIFKKHINNYLKNK